MPPALGLFSTTTGTPTIFWSAGATIRAARSVPPPAPKPTTILMLRGGQSCAAPGVEATARIAAAASATAAQIRIICHPPKYFWLSVGPHTLAAQAVCGRRVLDPQKVDAR